MNLILDHGVKAVLEFMQTTIPASRLEPTAKAVAAVAPIVWGHDEGEEVVTARLCADPTSPDVPHKQQAAI
jgi:hypothetical protein